MTFAVVTVAAGETRETVVGTIWAAAEPEAQDLARSLFDETRHERVVVRRAEEREIPLRLLN